MIYCGVEDEVKCNYELSCNVFVWVNGVLWRATSRCLVWWKVRGKIGGWQTDRQAGRWAGRKAGR